VNNRKIKVENLLQVINLIEVPLDFLDGSDNFLISKFPINFYHY